MTPRTSLVIYRASVEMTRDTSIGAVCNRISNLQEELRKADAWVSQAITAVRSSPDADPSWSDDDIAQQVLDRLESKGVRLTREAQEHGP